jgi:hypothetical protein
MVKRMNKIRLLVIALIVGFCSAGCDSLFENAGAPPLDESVTTEELSYFNGQGVGDACTADLDCRNGLGCSTNTCMPLESKVANEKCLLTLECGQELHCGWAGFCVASGEGGEGVECATSSDCERGLFCAFKGLGGYCTAPNEGAGDIDDECGEFEGDDIVDYDTANCMAGLACSVKTGTCMPGSILLTPDLFPGVDCPTLDEEKMSFGVRTLIPWLAEEAQDFYSLPFPNDIHAEAGGGKVTMLNHPYPGAGIMGFDPIGATLDAINEEIDGFSLLPGVYFRFTRPIDVSTLSTSGDLATVKFVNLESREIHPATVEFIEKRNKYICENHILVRPSLSSPLESNQQYAVIITNGIRSASADAATDTSAEVDEAASDAGAAEAEAPASESEAGVEPETDDSFEAETPVQLDHLPTLLSNTPPQDVAEDMTADWLDAWGHYAGLRDWLSEAGTPSADDVAGATVFTTGEPRMVMESIRNAIYTSEQLSVLGSPGYFVCDGFGTGHFVCATNNFDTSEAGLAGEADKRDCPEFAAANYYEVQMRINLPQVQEGDIPYLTVDEGGGLYVDDDGEAKISRHDAVCAGLTVPKGVPMPAEGWPLMIYGHGTGGSFRGGVLPLAENVSHFAYNGKDIHFATLTIDQPMHGNRKGQIAEDLGLDEGPLFYNFQNPRAAKANYFQGAADVFALVRFAKESTLPVAGEIGSVKFNPKFIMYHGHSQGGGNGPLVAPFEKDLGLMVLSGTGGAVPEGLLGKKEPYDASVGVSIMLHQIEVDLLHPAMHLLQYYFDGIDPGVYGALLDDPPSGKGIHMLHVYGINDSFTPFTSQRMLATTMNNDLGEPSTIEDWYDDIADLGINRVSYPITANRQVNGSTYTRATVEHENDPSLSLYDQGVPYDGHFVIYRNGQAINQFLQFVGSWAQYSYTNGEPQIPVVVTP